MGQKNRGRVNKIGENRDTKGDWAAAFFSGSRSLKKKKKEKEK